MILSERQFKIIYPTAPLSYCKPLNDAMAEFQINTNQRAAMFLAQIDHESGDLAKMEENLNYSADGLANTWRTRYAVKNADGSYPKIPVNGNMRYVPNDLAKRLARNPQAIANNCYADRMGNGNEASGDGWRYRGRGPIMNTGKEAYAKLAKALGIPLVEKPELLGQAPACFRAAAYYWKTSGFNEMADQTLFTKISQAINGGNLGLEDRKKLWVIARNALAS